MNVIILLILVVAAVFFALDALNVVPRRFGLLAAGLFCWVLTDLIRAVHRL